MSNLSDLLPAGAGAKVITATASGNLATGQAVALQSDGTVTAIAAVAEGLGSEVVFETAQSYYIQPIFDSSNNKVVIIYTDSGDSNHGKAIVGTVSGTSISFGTAVTFNAATTYFQSGTFDSNSNKVVIVFRDQGDSENTKAVVGTVSGTSISFGSEATISTNTLGESSTTFDSNLNKVVTFYKDTANSSYGTAAVGTVSGTSITFGTPVVFESAGSGLYQQSSCFDTSSNKTVLVYTDEGDGNQGTAIVGTVSGTSISFGTPVVFHAAGTANSVCAFDTTNNKVVIAYEDTADSEKGKSLVGTVSGTSISYGSEVEFEGGGIQEVGMTFDPDAGKAVVVYMDKGNSNYGTYAVGTVSGTSITYATPVVFAAATSERCTATYDTNSDKIVIGFEDGGNSNYGTSIVLQLASSNSTNFAGITNQAINNSASGEVVVEGGVITNGSLLPQTFTPSVGSEAVFQSSATYYTASVYDPDSGKTIIAWKGTSDYGYAVVATPASDNSITYGTPVAFNSAGSNYIDITYDTGQDKALITFTDASGSNKVRAVVGTVSGTSISFGSVLEVETNASDYPAVAYSPDSANSMVVYRDNGNSNYGTARVLTISGTSVSASSKVTFESANSSLMDIVYDTGSNKFVVSYMDGGNSNYGTAIVGSVSGTTPSFGTPTVFSSNTQYDINSAYDSANDKTVMFFKDNNTPTAMVGTVSGTSISFGSEVVVASQSNSDFYAMTFDSTANKIIVAYRDEDATPDDGVYFLGTVSGTSISFGSKQIFNDASTKSTSLSYNAGVDRTVIAYRDLGNSSYGTGIVLKITSANPNLAIGSTYYVQDDGTLSTTSSSVTAGKAIANTTLLLKG
jgi:hypothetical protein